RGDGDEGGAGQHRLQQRGVTTLSGQPLMQESYVCTADVCAGTASGWERIDWSVHALDERGRTSDVWRADGAHVEMIWGCCSQEYVLDAGGIRTDYVHDALGRVILATRTGVDANTNEGYAEQPDLDTAYEYDPLGRLVSTSVDPEGLNLATSSAYDLAGRLTSTTDESGLVTTYDYDTTAEGGRRVTVTQPGGATQVSAYYRDGRIRSVTGTAVVAQYHDYGVNDAPDEGDGTQWRETRAADDESPRFQRSHSDMLGRVVAQERPSYPSGTLTSTSDYDTAGRLVRNSAPGRADTLYEYDGMSRVVRTGLDCNTNGTLDLASTDRIQENVETYAEINGEWWRVQTSKTYATIDSGTATTTGMQRQRLTGLGGSVTGGILTGESQSLDIHGNVTTRRTIVDRDNKLVREVVDVPESDTDIVSITRNGLLQSGTTATGVTTTYQYDALGRRTGVTDPRTGTVTTHYDPDTHRVDYVEDASTNRTSYAYDEDTGRLASVTNALGNKTYYLYNDRGQVTHTWGDVPQPVVYGYDDYGQRTTLTTFRDDGVDWTADEWPTNPPEGDTTTWTYDEATGLVTAKRYADDKGPDYDYTADGRLSQRTWARQVGWPPEPLTTDYAYDPATGELTGIDYSDATPDVSFTYTRTGAPATVIDVVGTRTFSYNDAQQLETESTSGLYSRVISRDYETGAGGTLAGRYYKLMVGTSQDPDADYESTYGYDSGGRLNRVTGPGLPAYGAVYSFAADSDLVSQIAYKSDASTTVASTIRGFESTRGLITSIENKWGATTVSKYEYTNDGLDRRTSVTVSGSAFNTTGTTGFDLFTYNDRNELATAKRYTGGTLENPTNPVYTRHFGYDYDPIGNRESYQIGQGTATSYTTNELNQYTATADPSESFTHDDDGNLTQDGTFTYVWDAENRLIEAYPTNPTTGSQKCVMTYDYMNRRVQRSLYNWTGSAWAGTYFSSRIFVYDRWNNLIAYNPAGGLSAFRKNTWGLDLSGLNGNSPSPLDPNRDRQGAALPALHAAGGIAGLIGSTVANGLPPPSYLCFYDANGNLSETLKNSDGTLYSHHEYDPWGHQLIKYESAGIAHPFRYSTKYSDGVFEKYYFGFRYLDFGTGRWASRDPLHERGGRNLFAYTINAPLTFMDPLGLEFCCTIICHCSHGDIPFDVVSGGLWSDLMELLGLQGCITWWWGEIECTASCDALPDEFVHPDTGETVLGHECGHVCDLTTPLIGPLLYIVGALFDEAIGADGGVSGRGTYEWPCDDATDEGSANEGDFDDVNAPLAVCSRRHGVCFANPTSP
ncbi:MAG: hypothetical protein L6R00_20335, partial [Phycisphaerae bacterium]|nr:hypothetical protein [Phycisphaerae bacterium]